MFGRFINEGETSMQVYLYVEINIFALIILALIFLNIHRKTEKYLMEQKLYVVLLGINALILIADTFTWVFDGKNTTTQRIILILVTTIYYILNPIICMSWSIYVDFLINHNENRIKKLFIPMLIPVFL